MTRRERKNSPTSKKSPGAIVAALIAFVPEQLRDWLKGRSRWFGFSVALAFLVVTNRATILHACTTVWSTARSLVVRAKPLRVIVQPRPLLPPFDDVFLTVQNVPDGATKRDFEILLGGKRFRDQVGVDVSLFEDVRTAQVRLPAVLFDWEPRNDSEVATVLVAGETKNVVIRLSSWRSSPSLDDRRIGTGRNDDSMAVTDELLQAGAPLDLVPVGPETLKPTLPTELDRGLAEIEVALGRSVFVLTTAAREIDLHLLPLTGQTVDLIFRCQRREAHRYTLLRYLEPLMEIQRGARFRLEGGDQKHWTLDPNVPGRIQATNTVITDVLEPPHYIVRFHHLRIEVRHALYVLSYRFSSLGKGSLAIAFDPILEWLVPESPGGRCSAFKVAGPLERNGASTIRCRPYPESLVVADENWHSAVLAIRIGEKTSANRVSFVATGYIDGQPVAHLDRMATWLPSVYRPEIRQRGSRTLLIERFRVYQLVL